jgi:hypothetical protein
VWRRWYVSPHFPYFHVLFCIFFSFLFPFSFSALNAIHWGPLTVIETTPADRRPIDPPPIVQLRVIDKARKNLPSPSPSPPPQHHPQQQPPHPHAHGRESSGPLDTSMLTPTGFGGGPFLQNPYYFMFASLAKPDDDTELHWMKVRFLCQHMSARRFLASALACPLFTSSLILPSPRMERRDAPRDQSSRHYITSRIRKTTIETLGSSSFRI